MTHKLISKYSFTDVRGSFIKNYSDEFLQGLKDSQNLPVNFQIKESFFNISNKNVLRGMHFQKEPFAYKKIVSVVQGKILDVILDLRKSSLTYGQYAAQIFDQASDAIFIEKGFAHGFLALEDETIVQYFVDQKYSPECDVTLHFNSFGFKWPVEMPIVSDRDQQANFFDMKKEYFR